jgi:hypothetical protein
MVYDDQTNERNKAFDEIECFAKAMGLSLEEYLITLHEKNQSVKTVLLQDGHGYKDFIEDFHDLLDGMTIYKEAMLAQIKNPKEADLLNALVELLYKASSDPMLLAQLYEHYQKEDDETSAAI